jgi:hypothetical protein
MTDSSNEPESVEVLELKLQLLRAKKAKEDSVEILEVKVKLAEARKRESKVNSKNGKPRKKNNSSSTGHSKTKNNENVNPSGAATRTTIIRYVTITSQRYSI